MFVKAYCHLLCPHLQRAATKLPGGDRERRTLLVPGRLPGHFCRRCGAEIAIANLMDADPGIADAGAPRLPLIELLKDLVQSTRNEELVRRCLSVTGTELSAEELIVFGAWVEDLEAQSRELAWQAETARAVFVALAEAVPEVQS